MIAGIKFFATVICQNSDAVRAQTRAQLAEEVTELFSANMNDKQYAADLMRGSNIEKLSPVEAYQYSRHRNAWIQNWNNASYQYQTGLYADSEFKLQVSTVRADMRTYLGLICPR